MTVKRLRKSEGTFTSGRIHANTSISCNVSNRTIRRSLGREGYKYQATRRKGVLSELDFKNCMKWCRKIKKRNLRKKFWTNDVAFFMDGTGFEYKRNPLDQARAPQTREWRLKNEGLIVTAKGKKEGSKKCTFMVGISYQKGVVLCEYYDGSITGDKMVDIVESAFPMAFSNSISPNGRRVVMDGCPRQNCKKAYKAYDAVGAMIMKLPARSPDLNPIENFFHLVKRKLRQEAVQKQITKESVDDFCARICSCLQNFPVKVIDNLIDSMEKRVNLVLKCNGRRTKY